MEFWFHMWKLHHFCSMDLLFRFCSSISSFFNSVASLQKMIEKPDTVLLIVLLFLKNLSISSPLFKIYFLW